MRTLALFVLGVVACDRQPSEADARGFDPRAEATERAAAPSASASATAVPQRPTSKVPTLEEWNRVGEVTVKGSSALSCETKMIREWFRVACRGKNDTGGTPRTVKIVEGRQPGAHEYQVGGVTTLVTPYFPGTHLEAVFSWTDKSHKLVLDWPKDAPKPQILGVFEGAKSPLDTPKEQSKFRDAACKCERENPLFGIPDPDLDCDTVEVNDDCARSFASQECLLYQKCAMGEPNTPPICAAGHTPLFNRCAKRCSTAADCPTQDHVCIEMVEGSPKVCVN